MKKNLIYAAAALLLSGLASCSGNEPMVPENGGNVTFSVTLPAEMGTRSYSDGLSATQLHYCVYDEDNGSANIAALNGTATFAGRKADISLQLASGKSYSIVFWADVPGNSIYTYDISRKEVTVNYGMAAQDENRDAFTACESTFKVTGPISKSITLRRPFAQINVGTGDVDEAKAAGVEVKKTGMKVNGIYNTLNLATGAVSGESEYELTTADIPGAGESFPVTGYDYLAMNYVLVGADKATVDVTMTTDCPQNPEMTFSQVPVQRNYRTNIYGDLLTNPAKWEVIIDEHYAGSDINLNPADKIADGVYFNEADKTYKVTSKEGFKWVAENKTIQRGETFELAGDIDFEGEIVTPLKVAFNGEKRITIDGKGHTIKNLQFKGDKASIIAGALVGDLKNLNVENITSPGDYGDGFDNRIQKRFCGVIDNIYGNIENVHVKNITLHSAEGRIGAIVGIHNSGNMTDCSVENVTIDAAWSVGGVAGAINETNNRIYRNVRVKNVTISTAPAYWGAYANYKGAMVGDVYATGVEFIDCSIEGTVTGCDHPTLPLDLPDYGYTWNGTAIPAAE